MLQLNARQMDGRPCSPRVAPRVDRGGASARRSGGPEARAMQQPARSAAIRIGLAVLAAALLFGCKTETPAIAYQPAPEQGEYVIGPGDYLRVFVWRNEDLTVVVPVRPDGYISTPLIERIKAAGKTPTQLGREIEAYLSEFINTPIVNIIVESFVSTAASQVRVVGEIGKPRAILYRQGMTLLDVMIEIGGISDFARNKAKLFRQSPVGQVEIDLRVRDLLMKGDITANVPMHPGDILIIRYWQ
jgi:polysaccharide export outer membrane protein